MNKHYDIIQIHQGYIVDDQLEISLQQLSRRCCTDADRIIAMVNEGIIEPEGENKHAWRFSYTSVETVTKVRRLQRDLDVNLAGAALALHLLERIADLEQQIKVR